MHQPSEIKVPDQKVPIACTAKISTGFYAFVGIVAVAAIVYYALV